MSWHGIDGHDDVAEQFRRALGRGRLASSFLFVGPPGVGKRAFALKLAQTLLCQTRPEEAMDPCGECPGCVQVAARTHPDLILVAKPEDKSYIPLELLIGDKEHRMREGLCHDIGLKPFMGGRKVAIIDDADNLNAEGANSLLKTLEEPPPRSVLILIGTSPARQLPTIRSRCQTIRFRPLPEDLVAELLLRQGRVDSADEARRLATHGDGSPRQALELAEPVLWTFRESLLRGLAQPRLDSVRLAAAVSAFVNEAGKDAAPRRERFRQVVRFAAEFYRHVLLTLSGTARPRDATLGEAVHKARSAWPGDAMAAAACLDRCLEAFGEIDRNANQTTSIECWLDDLGRLMLGEPAENA
ncbi:MAG: DNA polymerase III subunit delta' [Planctomycetia bacterium]|nr:DNA polymerase III subunit delta' [Planctomycetia bacterium]